MIKFSVFAGVHGFLDCELSDFSQQFFIRHAILELCDTVDEVFLADGEQNGHGVEECGLKRIIAVPVTAEGIFKIESHIARRHINIGRRGAQKRLRLPERGWRMLVRLNLQNPQMRWFLLSRDALQSDVPVFSEGR